MQVCEGLESSSLSTFMFFFIKPGFGLLFDIDGVLLRGSTPIPEALKAIDLLKGRDGKLRVPIAFVTNSCGDNQAKADQLSSTFDVDVRCGKKIL